MTDGVVPAPAVSEAHEVVPAQPTQPKRKPKKASFEIGVVYRKNSRYFLAITESQLLTFIGGQPKLVTPNTCYDASMTRSLSVEDLCQKWNITFETLDAMTQRYLAPKTEHVRSSPRGSRRGKANADLLWRAARTVRLVY